MLVHKFYRAYLMYTEGTVNFFYQYFELNFIQPGLTKKKSVFLRTDAEVTDLKREKGALVQEKNLKGINTKRQPFLRQRIAFARKNTCSQVFIKKGFSEEALQGLHDIFYSLQGIMDFVRVGTASLGHVRAAATAAANKG